MGVEHNKKYYDDNMYKHIQAEEKYQPLYDKAVSFLPLNKQIEILDIGCGVGGLINKLLKNGYENCSGIDFSTFCIDYCKNRFNKNNFFEADLRNDSSKKFFEKPDVFISLEVLEHINDDISVIKMIPVGKLFIFSVPNKDYLTHVRSFKNIQEIKERYNKILKFEDEYIIQSKKEAKIFVIKSLRV